MAENNLHPCPFMQRCSLADETCSEEKSATCDVITNTTPPAPPEWNPAELVAVTMTRQQWLQISIWMQYCIDWHHCRLVWCRDCCDDRRTGQEKAAQHAATIQQYETVCKIIEEATNGESENR